MKIIAFKMNKYVWKSTALNFKPLHPGLTLSCFHGNTKCEFCTVVQTFVVIMDIKPNFNINLSFHNGSQRVGISRMNSTAEHTNMPITWEKVWILNLGNVSRWQFFADHCITFICRKPASFVFI